MATMAAPQRRLQSERRFFTGIAAVMVAATFIGFAPTYFLAGAMGGPPLSPLVHVHGALFSAWMLLFLGQASLIAAGRPTIHRKTGAAAAVLAGFMLVLGIAVAMEGARSGHHPGRDPAMFLFFPFTSIGLFAAFTTLAILRRGRPDHHRTGLVDAGNVVHSRRHGALLRQPRRRRADRGRLHHLAVSVQLHGAAVPHLFF